MRTHKHPAGCTIRVGILPVIGDLLAIRKVLGFAGVASKLHFCSFCKLSRNDIEELDVSKFIPQNGAEVRAAAQSWQEAASKKERTRVFQESGVWWSSLHLLGYRDHVKHTVLGLMHNWLEGVLQHHARVLWGIGVVTACSESKPELKKPQTSPLSDTTRSDNTSDLDFTMLDEEIEELHQESLNHS
jgi:hypothetical protein